MRWSSSGACRSARSAGSTNAGDSGGPAGRAPAVGAGAAPEVMRGPPPPSPPYHHTTPGGGPQPTPGPQRVRAAPPAPPMTQADTYDDLARLEQLLDEY